MPEPVALSGAMSALLTPILPGRQLDETAWEKLIAASLQAGLDGVVIAGGTGEYAFLDPQLRLLATQRAVQQCAGRATVIASIGAGSLDGAVALGEAAKAAGADALLLPPPHFYRYQQTDIEDFYRAAANQLPAPLLIYNLAAFVTPIETETALRLLEDCPAIRGIKDSSGSPEILARLTENGYEGARILGHDRVLAPLLRGGGLNGLISGPAGVIPEFAAALFRTQQPEMRDQLLNHYDEFLDHHDQFPYPYALKWIAEARGFCTPRFPIPLSPQRLAQREELVAWFQTWLARLEDILASEGAA